jgi:hypothetical protein
LAYRNAKVFFALFRITIVRERIPKGEARFFICR